MTTLLATSLAVLGVTGAPASASPCGNDSDSFSSSFDDSAFDSSTESTPCEGPCAEYNAWRMRNLPAIVVEVGTVMRTFASPLGERTGSVSHDGTSYAYRATGPIAGADESLETGVAAQLRVAAPMRWGFYAGAELELGGVASPTVHSEMMAVGPSITPGSAMMLGGVGVLGIGGRLADGIDIGAELAGGGRMISYNFDSHYGDCETSASIVAGQAVAEGRLRGTAWLSPRMNLTLFGGRSFVDDGLVGGIALGFSNQPYGQR